VGLFPVWFNSLGVVSQVLASDSLNAKTRYQLNDLEILEKNRAYYEFFTHARDILPSNRNEYWKNMVSNMAESWTQQAIKGSVTSRRDYRLLENLVTWPENRTNDLFLARRHKLAMRYFLQCYSNKVSRKSSSKIKEGKNCKERVAEFWGRTPKRPRWALKTFKFLLKHDTLELDEIWNYLKVVVNDASSEFLCKDPQVSDYSIQYLLQKVPSIKFSHLDEKVTEFFHPLCWRSLVGIIKKQLATAHGHQRREMIRVLLSKSQIVKENLGLQKTQQSELDILYILYMLSRPQKGDVFNLAWANLKELRDDYHRRKKVLMQLKSFDPLPDESFTRKTFKGRVILKEIQKNFPEYLDHYSKLCLSYLKGKGKFPNGNPTVHCRDFYQMTQGSSMIPPMVENGLTEALKLGNPSDS
jgi:hypothetical protein